MHLSKSLSKLLPLVLLSLVLGSCSTDPKASEQAKKPDILLIVIDDLGYNDIGAYGGNIATPVIDQIAREGMLFTNYHVLPTCSPSRSVMLSGVDNHINGLGIMGEMDYPALSQLALPGYTGHLSTDLVTIPDVLRSEYHTYMVGKWHLGEGPGQDPFFRGFEETFILGTGGGSHWNDKIPLAPPQHMEYTRNGKVVELPEDFYSTRNYTDSLIQFIGKNKDDGKPYFGFLSFTAVHDPLHAPKEFVEKYKGKFDMGWDSLLVERLETMKKLGLVPPQAKHGPNPAIPKWDSLSEEAKKDHARDMEVYAAMLDYVDMSLGRLFEFLKTSGRYDNTLIVIMSDNGANGAVATSYPGNEDGTFLASFDNSMENRGLKSSYIEMGPGWAAASSAPFLFFKGFTSEGGIRVPLIVKMPGNASNKGEKTNSLVHVSDLMPTFFDIAGINYPSELNGKKTQNIQGKSILPLLRGETADIHAEDGFGYELFEMKAYIKGNWKILRLPSPLGTGEWQLFDLENDPGETTDLSAQNAQKRDELIQAWSEYATANSVHDHRGHYDSLYLRTYSQGKKK